MDLSKIDDTINGHITSCKVKIEFAMEVVKDGRKFCFSGISDDINGYDTVVIAADSLHIFEHIVTGSVIECESVSIVHGDRGVKPLATLAKVKISALQTPPPASSSTTALPLAPIFVKKRVNRTKWLDTLLPGNPVSDLNDGTKYFELYVRIVYVSNVNGLILDFIVEDCTGKIKINYFGDDAHNVKKTLYVDGVYKISGFSTIRKINKPQFNYTAHKFEIICSNADITIKEEKNLGIINAVISLM